MRNKPPANLGTPRLFRELLQGAIAQLRERTGDAARDTVLYVGQRHQAFPSLIVEDPVLEPVDKIVWMTIWQRGAGGGTQALFPSYAEISANAHIGSDSTIARALAILRATRWLSLCARVRGKRGKFGGNIYAVHDEPLGLSDTLHLDPDYLRFLETARTHPHPRVGKVVTGVLVSLDTDIDAGVDVTEREHPISRRLEARHAIAHPGAYRYFSFTAEIARTLAGTQDQNSQSGRLQDLETVSCSSSSSSKYKTTTTDPVTDESAREPVLIYPNGFTDNQRLLALRYLTRVPESERQAVLDELEGRLRAVRQGAKPVYDPLRYLHRLCMEVVQGSFVVNLGSKVAAERHRREIGPQSASTDQTLAQAPVTESSKPEKKPGESPVAGIRKQFGLPTRTIKPT